MSFSIMYILPCGTIASQELVRLEQNQHSTHIRSHSRPCFLISDFQISDKKKNIQILKRELPKSEQLCTLNFFSFIFFFFLYLLVNLYSLRRVGIRPDNSQLGANLRDCSQILSAIFGGVWTPPPPLSVIVSNWLTPPPPFFSDVSFLTRKISKYIYLNNKSFASNPKQQ